MSHDRDLNPLSLKYMKMVRICLKTVGSWPSDALSNKPVKFKKILTWVICQVTMVLTGQIIFIYHNFRNLTFFLLGDVCLIMFLTFLTWYRCIQPAFKTYEAVVAKFVNKFHLIHFRHKGDYFETMYLMVNKLSYYFTLVMMLIMVSAMVLFNISPMYNNYRNGVFTNNIAPNYTLQFSVYYKFPGYDQKSHFTLTTFANMWLSYLCSVEIVANDLLLSFMVFQIIGHIQVLNYNLEHFPKPSGATFPNSSTSASAGDLIKQLDLFNAEENKLIHKKIVECVHHHRLIVSFTEEVSNFYGPMLGLNYLYDMVGCCLILLECTSGEPGALARYGPIAIIAFGQLIQVSVTFEVVGSKSEKMIEAVYSVPWESMDMSNQRSVSILLKRVQTPIHVTAMGITTIGVTTMLQILKATMSYFAFLRSINE